MGRPASSTIRLPELAGLLGKSPRTVTAWAAAGMPTRTVDGSRCVVVSEAHVWLMARERESGRASVAPADERAERIAHLKARRELAELDLASRRGELCTREQFEDRVSGIYESVKANILAVPTRDAHRLVGHRDMGAAFTVLQVIALELLAAIGKDGN